MTTKDIQVFAVDWKSTHGFLSVMMEVIPEDGNSSCVLPNISKTFNFSKTTKQPYQRIKSTKPIIVRNYTVQNQIFTGPPISNTIADNKSLRIQERINKVK